MTYSSIGIYSLIIHLIINYDILKNSSDADKKPEYKTFRRLLLSITAFYISDILWGILYEMNLTVYTHIDTDIYFVFMGLTIFLWTRYVVAYLNVQNRFSRLIICIGYIYLIANAIAIVANLFTPLFFFFDEAGVYHAGKARYALLCLQIILYFLASIYTLFVNIRTEGKVRLRYRSIGFFSLFMAVLIVLQVMFALQPLYSTGLTIGICLLHKYVLEDEKEEQRQELEKLIEKEKEQKKEISSAKQIINTDYLTSVDSKYSFIEAEAKINKRIDKKAIKEFSIIIFDLNDLKQINDEKGHKEGDECLKNAAALISKQFSNSKIFRIGGDEFLAILEGRDYKNRNGLLAAFESKMENNQRKGDIVISTGMSDYIYGEDKSIQPVFNRADRKMYERKHYLKTIS